MAHFVDKNQLALKAIDGFLLILSDNGEITFVSPNIAEYLGLSQVNVAITGFVIAIFNYLFTLFVFVLD